MPKVEMKLTEDMEVIITTKSGFAFSITLSDTEHGIHVAAVGRNSVITWNEEGKTHYVISIYGCLRGV